MQMMRRIWRRVGLCDEGSPGAPAADSRGAPAADIGKGGGPRLEGRGSPTDGLGRQGKSLARADASRGTAAGRRPGPVLASWSCCRTTSVVSLIGVRIVRGLAEPVLAY